MLHLKIHKRKVSNMNHLDPVGKNWGTFPEKIQRQTVFKWGSSRGRLYNESRGDATRRKARLIIVPGVRYRTDDRLQSVEEMMNAKKACCLGRTNRCLNVKHSESVSAGSASTKDFERYKGRVPYSNVEHCADWRDRSKPTRLAGI